MRARSIWLITALLPLAACGVTEPQQAPGAWDVTITGRGEYPQLRGTAGVASQFGATNAALRIEGYPNAVFTWRLHRGSCATPGTGIGVPERYPELRLGSAGSAEASASINQMLDRDGEFSLIVRTAAGAVAACGDLRRFLGARGLDIEAAHLDA
jgi:hypothetical protein